MDGFQVILAMLGSRGLNPELVRETICLMFDGYKKRKRSGSLYSGLRDLPKSLIEVYWTLGEKQDLSQIYTKFKRKYIINENNLEDVHNKKERLGLGEVYDFINEFNDKDHWINIYIILKMHQLLYSKVDYPEFGGSFRIENCFISSSDVPTTPYDMIPGQVAALYQEFDSLLKRGRAINERRETEELIDYINDVIKLKCKLIKIHPFKDGNGRTCRALVNLLFKQVELPPVYIQKREKEEYIKAMDNAVRSGNYESIQGFYYYKLCDAIVDLNFDISLEDVNSVKRNVK